MAKRLVTIAFVVLFIFGAVACMAAEGAKAYKKNHVQAIYNWFGTWDKLCVNKSERFCRVCKKKCCDDCNMDCGGTCCADCLKNR